MKAIVAACSIQNKRDEQQDNMTYRVSEGLGGDFFAVADGMGGHYNGAEASEEAITAFSELIEPFTSLDAAKEWMYTVSESIRKNGYQAGERDRSRGTTFSGGIYDPEDHTMMILHCGDSRVYRLRAGKLEYLTMDHTGGGMHFSEGRMSQAQYEAGRGYMGILSHLGCPPMYDAGNFQRTPEEVSEFVRVDVSKTPVQEGDIYLFCTDGVSGKNSFEWIREILSRESTPEEKAQALMEMAEEKHTDNATCIVVEFSK